MIGCRITRHNHKEWTTLEDDFATNHSSYSRDHYYIAATDNKGHRSKSYMSVPPQVKGEIASLIASRSIPVYRTETDFWRDAGVHRLHELAEMLSESAPVFSGRLEILARRLATESELEYERRLIEADETLLEDAMFLMAHPPSFTTMAVLHRAVSDIGDVEIKMKLSRELEVYESRYRKD